MSCTDVVLSRRCEKCHSQGRAGHDDVADASRCRTDITTARSLGGMLREPGGGLVCRASARHIERCSACLTEHASLRRRGYPGDAQVRRPPCVRDGAAMLAQEGAPLRWLGRRLHDKANGNSVFPMFCRSIRLVPVDSWSFDQVNRMHRCRDAEHHLVRRIPRAGACASPPRASAALHEGRTPGSDWHTACLIVT